jgi:hypothetical protein
MNWLPTAIAIVLFLGSATVYLRGSKDKGTIVTLTQNNAALTERVAILEASDLAKTTQINALTAANLVLQKTVNSSELIHDLREDLTSHHRAAMEGLEQVHSDLAGLPVKLAVVLMKGGK